MKLYYFIGRLLHPFMIVAFYVFSILTHTPRVRTVVKNENQEILLVQSWSGGDIWGLPGGGVEPGEPKEQAASRELLEETGIALSSDQLRQFAVIPVWGHEEIVFICHTLKSSLPPTLPNRFEIKKADWFSLTDMPKLGSLAQDVIDKVALDQ